MYGVCFLGGCWCWSSKCLCWTWKNWICVYNTLCRISLFNLYTYIIYMYSICTLSFIAVWWHLTRKKTQRWVHVGRFFFLPLLGSFLLRWWFSWLSLLVVGLRHAEFTWNSTAEKIGEKESYSLRITFSYHTLWEFASKVCFAFSNYCNLRLNLNHRYSRTPDSDSPPTVPTDRN